MAKTKKTEQPKDRFCIACDNIIHSTERDFANEGHVDTVDRALSVYKMKPHESSRILHRARSQGRLDG